MNENRICIEHDKCRECDWHVMRNRKVKDKDYFETLDYCRYFHKFYEDLEILCEHFEPVLGIDCRGVPNG